MRPLQYAAVGLLIVTLTARLSSGFDLLADPVGWALVLLASIRMGARELRWPILAALSVSAALWVPAVNDRLQAADPALVWAANLPQVIALVLLCRWLHRTAGASPLGQPRAARDARWWRDLMVAELIVGVLPVLANAAGAGVAETSYAIAGLVMLAIIVLLLLHADRPWARPDREPDSLPE